MKRNVVIVALVQAAVLTTLAIVLPTWQDEEFTLATTAHGIGYAIERALSYELQAPLYFALLAALRTLSASIFFAREFSVVTSVATTFVCARIARRIWPGRDPWVFCALFASTTFAVFAAEEIRTYSLALLESAALVAFFFEGFFYANDRRARFAFIATAVVGLYTQYFIAFDVAALFVALVVAGRFVALRVYVVSAILAVVAFIPLAFALQSQAHEALSIESSGQHFFGGMLLHPVNLVLSRQYAGAGPAWERVVWMVLRLVLLAAIVFGRPRVDLRRLALGAIFVGVDAIYVVLADIGHVNFVYPRHYVALYVPEAILLYAIVASFSGRYASRFGILAAVVVASANAVALYGTYATGAKFGDAARVGAYLSSNARPGDAIAAYPGDYAPPIVRYYHGPLAIAGYPVAQDPNVYHVDAALVRSRADALAAFARLPRARHLWFAMLGTCDTGNIHGCATVLAVVHERFRVLERREFFQAIVFELESK